MSTKDKYSMLLDRMICIAEREITEKGLEKIICENCEAWIPKDWLIDRICPFCGDPIIND